MNHAGVGGGEEEEPLRHLLHRQQAQERVRGQVGGQMELRI